MYFPNTFFFHTIFYDYAGIQDSEQPDSLAFINCSLVPLWRASMWVFWTSVKSAVSHIYIIYRLEYTQFVTYSFVTIILQYFVYPFSSFHYLYAIIIKIIKHNNNKGLADIL